MSSMVLVHNYVLSILLLRHTRSCRSIGSSLPPSGSLLLLEVLRRILPGCLAFSLLLLLLLSRSSCTSCTFSFVGPLFLSPSGPAGPAGPLFPSLFSSSFVILLKFHLVLLASLFVVVPLVLVQSPLRLCWYWPCHCLWKLIDFPFFHLLSWCNLFLRHM